MFRVASCLLAALAAASVVRADSHKLTDDQKIELLRGLTAEYATIKSYLPQSRKPLDFNSDGTWDKQKWQDAGRQLGIAGKVGDLIQVTHVGIDKDEIVLELNHGTKGKGHWYDHIQVGMNGAMNPVNPNAPNQAAHGTTIAVRFPDGIGDVTSVDIKKLLQPVLDFDKHSVTEQYIDTLPAPIKKAIQEKKPIEGMDRDQVLLAMGHPFRKTRETRDGVDYEDWIYGEPPGRVTFVTFAGKTVVKVKDEYAGLGGSIAETPRQP
jgi:hypothetical protein